MCSLCIAGSPRVKYPIDEALPVAFFFRLPRSRCLCGELLRRILTVRSSNFSFPSASARVVSLIGENSLLGVSKEILLDGRVNFLRRHFAVVNGDSLQLEQISFLRGFCRTVQIFGFFSHVVERSEKDCELWESTSVWRERKRERVGGSLCAAVSSIQTTLRTGTHGPVALPLTVVPPSFPSLSHSALPLLFCFPSLESFFSPRISFLTFNFNRSRRKIEVTHPSSHLYPHYCCFFSRVFSFSGTVFLHRCGRVDDTPGRELEMELLVISLSLWILQCRLARADSIIHIGKAPGATSRTDRKNESLI